MKHRLAACLITVAVVLIVWQAIAGRTVYAQAAPAVNPFADGLSIPDISGTETLFARDINGAYVRLEVNSEAPYSLLRSTSTVLQLLSGGLQNLLAAPAGPAGVGRQSQAFAVAVLNGLPGGGFRGADSVTVIQGTSELSVTSTLYPHRTGCEQPLLRGF